VKALRPWIRFEAEPYSISSYLLGFGGPTKEFTFYKRIKSLAPGDFMTVRRGERPRPETFFSVSDFWDGEEMRALDGMTPVQATDRLEEELFASVKRQMFADSRVG